MKGIRSLRAYKKEVAYINQQVFKFYEDIAILEQFYRKSANVMILSLLSEITKTTLFLLTVDKSCEQFFKV